MNKEDKVIIGTLAVIIGIFILIILFRPSQVPEQPEIVNYNGFEFIKQGNYWKTYVIVQDAFSGEKTEYEILFHYTPLDVENIETLKNSRNETTGPNLFMNAKQVYITFDPDLTELENARVLQSGVELAKIMSNIYKKNVKSAITKDANMSGVPIITCEDIDENTRVIYLKIDNSTRIYNTQGCVIVEGKDGIDLLKASERLSFEMLKIL